MVNVYYDKFKDIHSFPLFSFLKPTIQAIGYPTHRVSHP